MNMILHDNPMALIMQGNTLANPLFLNENGALKTYDYVVANPPFSDKRWGNALTQWVTFTAGLKTMAFPRRRTGITLSASYYPLVEKQGQGSVHPPHGVLFRGGAEAEIRKNIIRKGYIKESSPACQPLLWHGYSGLYCCA